jgi:hypothetical protein
MIALAPVLLALAVSTSATAAAQPGSPSSTNAATTTLLPVASAPPPPGPPTPRRVADTQHATMGDVSGGQYIPPPILAILADPRIDPDVAYMLWQLSRRPLDGWKLSELAFVAQIAPTEVEAGLSITKLQTLYQFWGLDPADVFNPSLGANWQTQSTAYSPDSATSVGAISSADCQVDASQMTLGTYRSCIGASQ